MLTEFGEQCFGFVILLSCRVIERKKILFSLYIQEFQCHLGRVSAPCVRVINLIPNSSLFGRFFPCGGFVGIAGIEAAFLFANQRDRGPAIWGPYYGARVGQKTVTPSFSQIKGSFSKHIVGFPDLNKYVIP